ncbi:HNH endonuclease [Pasteurella multocida]
MKICIICRKEFTTTRPATKEHIIPESIGGNYIIETVCKDCNSKMGTKIDAPFVKNLISRLHIEENQI